MSQNLNEIMIQDLRIRVYELLDKHAESYDYHHIRHVEKYCYELAKLRNLNPSIALAMALLHDHGRIINKAVGNKHVSEGAILAAEWLAPYDLDQNTLSIIVTAIQQHNRKSRISDYYSELLKDADSLAHQDECQDQVSQFEMCRAKDALLKPLTIERENKILEKEVMDVRMSELDKKMKKLIKKDFSNKSVHNFRINIRQLRAFLWLGKDLKTNSKQKQLDKVLKKAYKALEEPRRLRVLRKTLKIMGVDLSLIQSIDKTTDLEEKKSIPLLKEQRKIINKLSISKLKVTRREIRRKTLSYQKKLMRAYKSSDDLKILHALRICGKNIKYLMEENIITFACQEDYELLNALHKTIGELNDITDSKNLLAKLEKEQGYERLNHYFEDINTYFEDEDKRLQKDIKLLLFRAYKRWLMY